MLLYGTAINYTLNFFITNTHFITAVSLDQYSKLIMHSVLLFGILEQSLENK